MPRVYNNQEYTINPLTGKYIKKSGDLWKKLSTVFFTDKENNFLNQRIPSGDYFNNQWGTKVPRETHDTPINPRMTPAFSNSNSIYVFVIACHYSSNNQSLKILPWA